MFTELINLLFAVLSVGLAPCADLHPAETDAMCYQSNGLIVIAQQDTGAEYDPYSLRRLSHDQYTFDAYNADGSIARVWYTLPYADAIIEGHGVDYTLTWADYLADR